MKEMFAPYAPPSAVLAVIQFYRKRDVPASVNLTNLQQIGVTEALAPRVLAALKFLNLLNEDGTTTEQFRAIRYASDDDYTQVLTGILEAAYKGVLDHLDITTAGEKELNNAFIPYSPGGQRQRMITLFQALAKEAGWPLAVEPKPSSPRGQSTRQPSRPKAKIQGLPRPLRPSGASTPPPANDSPVAQGSSAGLRLSVTDADLMALPESDFDTVWKALGLLQKAKRQAALDNQRLKDAIAASRDGEDTEEEQ
jgi:hypothetical protein